jgi:hypothetical protein
MGTYVNPTANSFAESINSQIYVDKTGLLEQLNKIVNTEQKFICVSRPRRFGKSMAAKMLSAYYGKCESRQLFENLRIAKSDSFEKHLNKYNVIHLNMVDYMTETKNVDEMIRLIEDDLFYEFEEEFPDVELPPHKTLIRVLNRIYAKTNVGFIFVIDEWDCIFRRSKNDTQSQTKYLDFLRNILKDKPYIALAYMTGILPIKKYGEHSALNMFTEVSMNNPREYAEFTGFTDDEVKTLCTRYDMSYEETKRWYNGYNLKGIPIYNPRSVVMSMTGHDYDNYWTQTETYEALKVYIMLDMDGLQDKVKSMIAGEQIQINTRKFENDMTTFACADDVLTLLIHLGYLTYDFDSKTCRIPNEEIRQEFISCIEDDKGWSHVMSAIRQSDELMQLTLDGKADEVATAIEKVHQENTSILQYNNENSLSSAISLAYYSARKDYIFHRELQGGKGFADIVLEPRYYDKKPAMIIELKWDKSAETAIEQIKNKKYVDSLKDYSGKVILVGVSYDRESKEYSCLIEETVKE